MHLPVASVAYATFDNSRAFQRTVTVVEFFRVASRRMKIARMIQASLTRRSVIVTANRGLKSTAIFGRRGRDEIPAAIVIKRLRQHWFEISMDGWR